MTFLAFFVFAFFGSSGTAQADDAIRYQIKPIRATDRTNLEIRARFKAENNGSVKIKLPQDCFGSPDIYRYVARFEGEAGTVVAEGATDAERTVKPNAAGDVQLQYVLSFDPVKMNDNPYAPHTSANHFHVAGCQFLLPIGDENQKRLYAFEIVDAPQNWRLYSTLNSNARNFEKVASYEELASSAIGGGAESRVFKVQGKPVSVFLHGKLDLPEKDIYLATERIVKIERGSFDDNGYPFFQIVIAPRGGFVSGYAPSNSFVCFVKPEISKDELTVLLAHELMHNWLPGKIKIVPDKPFTRLRDEWFDEGVTDYLARKLLLDNDLITREKFAELVNQDIINIADNSHRAATYEDLSAAARAGRYNTAYKKLAYYRGALMALNWETELQRKNGKKVKLIDFIRALYRSAAKTDGKISEQAFFDLARGFGLDAKKDLEKFILRGEAISVLPDALGKTYELRQSEVPSFEPGFSLAETFKTRKIVGVIENGAAHRAGLRDGMEFVSIENSNRFANGWSAKKPLVVTIKNQSRTRRAEFFPHGATIKLHLFQPRK
jgi:predicted metalloprotease with PDZ domain